MGPRISNAVFLLACTIGSLMVILSFSVGCMEMDSSSSQSPEPTEPGLYNIYGWAGQPYHSYGNKADDADIDGTVGHPLYVACPTARAVPREQGWSMSYHIAKGELPPGIYFDTNNHDSIAGIPTERGHWIVDVEVTSLSVGSQTYNGYTQQLRFHITGSGEVH